MLSTVTDKEHAMSGFEGVVESFALKNMCLISLRELLC